jgi:hypothetical protein
MLFEIDETVSELLSEGELAGPDRQGITHLAIAAAEGSHRITGRRKVLQRLAESPWIGPRERAAFTRAAGRVAEDGALPRRVTVLGRVVATGDTRPTAATNGGQRVITFPIRWFDITAKIQPVVLLAENLSDVEVYRKIGGAASRLASLGYLPLSLSERHGGGNTIGQVLDGLAQSDAICLCIVDSDKSCPLSREGDTARTVIGYRNILDYPLIEVLLTPGRDLENSLPDSFYSSTYGAGSLHAAMTNMLEEFSRGGNLDLRRHLDVKKGFVLRDLFGFPGGSAEAQFWEAGLDVILAIRGMDRGALACMSSRVCPKARRWECECELVGGNGSNILETYALATRGADAFTVVRSLEAHIRDDWRMLGTAVASWCCGDSRLRN